MVVLYHSPHPYLFVVVVFTLRWTAFAGIFVAFQTSYTDLLSAPCIIPTCHGVRLHPHSTPPRPLHSFQYNQTEHGMFSHPSYRGRPSHTGADPTHTRPRLPSCPVLSPSVHSPAPGTFMTRPLYRSSSPTRSCWPARLPAWSAIQRHTLLWLFITYQIPYNSIHSSSSTAVPSRVFSHLSCVSSCRSRPVLYCFCPSRHGALLQELMENMCHRETAPILR